MKKLKRLEKTSKLIASKLNKWMTQSTKLWHEAQRKAEPISPTQYVRVKPGIELVLQKTLKPTRKLLLNLTTKPHLFEQRFARSKLKLAR